MHAGWGPETYGSLNVLDGEYDAPLYYQVTFGLPVYVSFRGCFHFIELDQVGDEDRRKRIIEFATNYAVEVKMTQEGRAGRVMIPLKPLPALRRMARAFAVLWVLFVAAFMAPLISLAIWNSGRALNTWEPAFLTVCWTSFALFVAGVILYLRKRRITPIQRSIRESVSRTLGPQSDPADWKKELASWVADARYGTTAPADLLQRARELKADNQHDEALFAARVALALLPSNERQTLREDLERLSQQCTFGVLLKGLKASAAA